MNKIIVIVGPTAIGKTELAINIAQVFNGEIINADSMQVYRQMEIGTAKPSKQEFNKVPHHLFNIVDIKDSFSVADFQKQIKKVTSKIIADNKLPIIVGGTGLYIKAFLYNYEFEKFEARSSDEKYQDKTNEELYDLLLKVDIETSKKIHVNNRKRLIRALDIYYNNKTSKSTLEKNQALIPTYDAIIIGLTMEREHLYQRINQRVDLMFEKGLEKEAKEIINNAAQNSTALQAIGYKEFIPYINGLVSLESTKDIIKQNTRNYAKRQYTYFNNQLKVKWFNIEETKTESIIEYINQKLVEDTDE